jgi:hypothetical protein
MSDRTCIVCGETKPKRSFWNAKRRLVHTCTDCRRTARKKEQYRAEKKVRFDREVKAMTKRAIKAQAALLKETMAAAVLRELNKLIAQPRSLVRKYTKKLEHGTGSYRTKQGLENQTRRLDYLLDIKRIVELDAAVDDVKPLEYYLTNTYLLNKHGYVCRIDPDDEDLAAV